MARLKLDDNDLDLDELDVEVEESNFQPYDGEIPPSGKVFECRITKMWLSYSADDTAMLVALAVVEDEGPYEGLPIFEYMVLKASAAFKYQPFLHAFGLTLRDVKTKMDVADEDDKIGAPITAIAKWEVGSDDALCRVVTKREKYQGEWQAKIGSILPAGEDDEDEPARGARTATAKADPPKRGRRQVVEEEVDEAIVGDEDEDGDEPEDEPAKPTRARRGAAAATPAAKKRSRRASVDEDDAPF
jgi:hypothetical protein